MNEETVALLLALLPFSVIPFALFWNLKVDTGVRGEADDGNIHLTFDEFLAFYYAAPEKWDVEEYVLFYKMQAPRSVPDFCSAMGSARVEVTFLKIRDVLRYGKFAKKTEAQRLSARSDALKADLIKEVTKDAENLHRSAMKDLFRGAEAYAEIVRRCKKS